MFFHVLLGVDTLRSIEFLGDWVLDFDALDVIVEILKRVAPD